MSHARGEARCSTRPPRGGTESRECHTDPENRLTLASTRIHAYNTTPRPGDHTLIPRFTFQLSHPFRTCSQAMPGFLTLSLSSALAQARLVDLRPHAPNLALLAPRLLAPLLYANARSHPHPLAVALAVALALRSSHLALALLLASHAWHSGSRHHSHTLARLRSSPPPPLASSHSASLRSA